MVLRNLSGCIGQEIRWKPNVEHEYHGRLLLYKELYVIQEKDTPIELSETICTINVSGIWQ